MSPIRFPTDTDPKVVVGTDLIPVADSLAGNALKEVSVESLGDTIISDKTTTDITEGTNLYYTDARVEANNDVVANTSARHTHSNKAILDATTASYTTAEQSKLAGIEAGAEVNDTANEVKTKYESNADTNAFTDAEKSKLATQSGTNTGDQDLSTLALKTNVLEKDNTTVYSPTSDYHPATKKYVDDNGGGGGSSVWGGITGTLSDQTDLQTALDSKIDGTQSVVTVLGGDDTTIPTSKAVADAIGGAGGGDMLKAVYDTNNKSKDVFDTIEGVMLSNTDADSVTTGGRYGMIGTPTNGAIAGEFALDVTTDGNRVMQIGTYSNGAVYTRVYNGTSWGTWNKYSDIDKQDILSEGAFIDGDKTKLDGISSGAEVNTINSGDNVSSLVNDAGYATGGGTAIGTNTGDQDLSGYATLTGTESLTNKSVNGVTLTAAGVSTAYLNAAGTYTTPAGGGGGTGLTLYDGVVDGEIVAGKIFETGCAGTATLSKLKISTSTQPTTDLVVKLYKNGVEDGSATITTSSTPTNGRYVANTTVFVSGSYVEDDRITVEIVSGAANNFAWAII